MPERPPPNLDTSELARFSAMAESWWDPHGELKALHDINPVRLDFVRAHAGLKGSRVLDVGCGGGLIAEALAAAGAQVTAIDMAEKALAVARAHCDVSGLSIDYRRATVEEMAEQDPNAFDVVTCMELVEHVPDPASIVRACGRLTRPGGHIFFSTVNRTWPAYLLVILASEYLFGIVHRGTHHYRRFVRPSELTDWGRQAGLCPEELSGLRYIPFFGYAALCTDTHMNYLMHFVKPASLDKKDCCDGSMEKPQLV
jgi:2-polyprenyl-6-hydroxyphenyl methylase / 3-demethylubiquinone-9 3-methyltransferase